MSESISRWVDSFNDLNRNAETSKNRFKIFYDDLKGVDNTGAISEYFKEIQASGEGAKATINDVYGAVIGETKGFKNINRVMKQYNSLIDTSGAQQAEFAGAVGQSNISFGAYLKSLNGAKGSVLGYAGSLAIATAKAVAFNLATTALSMGVSLVVSGLISIIASFVNAQQEALDKAQEMVQAIQEDTNSISNYIEQIVKLRKELEDETTTTAESISIRSKLLDIQNDLIENYGVERSNINLLTGDIESQTEALKELSAEKYKNSEFYKLNSGAVESARNAMNDQTVKLNWGARGGMNAPNDVTSVLKSIYEKYGFDTITDDLTGMFLTHTLNGSAYEIDKTLSHIQDEIQAYLNDDTISETLKANYQTAFDYLGNVRRDWSQKLITDNEDVFAQWLINASDYNDDYWNLVKERANLEYAIENGNKEDIVKAKLAWDEVYQNIINNVDISDSAVVGYYEKIFGDISEKGTNAINGIKNTSTDATHTALETLKADFATLQETFNGTLSNQSTFQTALDKIAEGTALTTDEVNKLVALYPELASTFTQTADGWTTSADNIISANKDIVKSTKDSIKAQIEGIQELYAQRDEIMDMSVNSVSDYEYKNDLVAALGIDEAEKQLPVLNLMLKMLNANTSSSTDTLAELQAKFDDTAKSVNTLSSNFKTLSSAFAEYNESGTISIDTALGLIDAGYAAVVSFNAETGAIELNKNAYIQLTNAKIEEQEVSLKLGLNAAQEEKFNTEHEIVANLGWSYLGATESKLMMGKANAKLANNTELIASYEAEISALETLKGSIDSVLTGDYGNSSKTTDNSDPWKDEFDKAYAEKQHLLAMGEIDETEYLNWLENAYKTYFADVSKYQEEYWKYEEEVFTKRAKLVEDSNKAITDSFEKTKDGYSDLVDDNSVKSMEKYVEKWKELVNSTYAGKPEFSDEYIAEMKAISEYEEKITEKRVNNEIKYWENQKKKAEKNYQDQIDEIEKLADAEDKLVKKEQLRLDILKAEKKLLDAKNNKNQLVLANGKFSYEANQDEILNAEKELTSANESYQDELIQEQVDILKEKKEQDSADFDTVIDILNAYKDKETPITESDSTVVNDAINSEYGQAVVKQAAEDKELSIEEYVTSLGGIWDKDKFDNLIGNVGQINSNIEKAFEDITKSVVNNQNINNNANNQSVTMGDVHITVQGGTSEQMLNEFANKLGTKIRELTQKNFSN